MDKVKYYTDQYVPCHFVTISDSKLSPPYMHYYVTLLVKCLLRKRNKLVRRGLKNKADPLTDKIGKLIQDHRSNCLSNVDSSSSSKLWKIVNSSRGQVKCHNTLLVDNKPVDPNELNYYFAGIAIDNQYDNNILLWTSLNRYPVVTNLSCRILLVPL